VTRVTVRLILACFLFAFEIIAGSRLAAEDLAPPPAAQPTPVTRQEVWQAVVAELRQRGLSEQQLPRIEDLDLPVALPAVAGRKLQVLSACSEGVPERTQFRLECGEPGQCLPFLVYVYTRVKVHTHDEVHTHDDGKVPAGWRFGSCRLESEAHPASGAPLKPPPKPTVLAGDRATAVFVSDRLRITASVTCLDRGRDGDIIRVRNQDGEVFRARISGPALLEAVPQ
jgi:hypothetical protein